MLKAFLSSKRGSLTIESAIVAGMISVAIVVSVTNFGSIADPARNDTGNPVVFVE